MNAPRMNSPRNCRLWATLAAALVAGVAIAPGAAIAAGTRIAAVAIDGLYQKDGKGLYDQMIAAVSKQSGRHLDIRVLAPNRAFKDFETGKVACISPANSNPDFYDFQFETVESSSMTTAKVFIFTTAGSQPLSELSDLNGMKVGIRTGMPYGSRVEKAGLNLIKAKTDEANVKKLKAGRIDAFLAYTPDMLTVFQDLGMSPLPYAADKPVAVHEDTVLCRKDKGGDEIVAAFNAGFKEIEASGELDKILGE